MKNRKKQVSIIIVSIFLFSLVISNINISKVDNLNNRNNSSNGSSLDDDLKNADPFIPPPPPNNQSFNWDFSNNTIKAFHWFLTAPDKSVFGTNYFNITSMPYGYNYSGRDSWEYCVQLQEVIYNSTLKTHVVSPLNPNPLNVSCVNLTTPYLSATSFEQESDEGFHPNNIFILNTFIPSNGSLLALNWSAYNLRSFYNNMAELNVLDELTVVDDPINNIYLKNSLTGAYVNLTYDDNGILKEGELYYQLMGEVVKFYVYVDDNINPIDDLEWSAEKGEELYYGFNRKEIRFNITEIVNETLPMPQMNTIFTFQSIYANVSFWIYQPGYFIGWSDPMKLRIGCANEIYPYIPFFGDTVPLVLPKSYDMALVAAILKMISDDPLDAVFGNDWLNVFNATGFTNYKYNVTGLLELIESKNMMDWFGEREHAVWYQKNSTIINSGLHTIDIKPLGTKVINATFNISVIADTHLLYSGFNINPINISRDYGVFYIDVWINNSDNLNPNGLNITFEYDPNVYKDVEIWYFNISSQDPNEAWKQLPYDVIEKGKIVVKVNFTAIFVFTDIPLSQYIGNGGGGGGGDDDKKSAQIPMGHYYLIFIAITLIGLVIYKKRKL